MNNQRVVYERYEFKACNRDLVLWPNLGVYYVVISSILGNFAYLHGTILQAWKLELKGLVDKYHLLVSFTSY